MPNSSNWRETGGSLKAAGAVRLRATAGLFGAVEVATLGHQTRIVHPGADLREVFPLLYLASRL